VPTRAEGLDLAPYLKARARLVERALAAHMSPGRSRLREAIRYSLLAGGKRIRPILTLATGEVCGVLPRVLMPFACALEMIHTYSLVHDDLPAMDDDDVRRGRPTSHRVYGEGMAILVGDALLTEAFALVGHARGVPAPRVVRALAELADAAGEAGMVGGQALDLAASGQELTLAQVRNIHRRKTGALLRAAVRVGAIAAGAKPALLARLSAYGEHLGLAFQIVDDIEDAAGAGDGRTDEQLRKATYPSTVGLAEARRLARRERDASLAAIARLGDRAAALRAIAEMVVDRVGEV
jgi:geranylgeranyl diphosphate synthase type II